VTTTKGVSRFDAGTKEMSPDSAHPGVTGEEILENTGSGLRVAPDIEKTKPPA
jgi:acyl CoA:acetate/3-ketoacid CoA transferase beta subunit